MGRGAGCGIATQWGRWVCFAQTPTKYFEGEMERTLRAMGRGVVVKKRGSFARASSISIIGKIEN